MTNIKLPIDRAGTIDVRLLTTLLFVVVHLSGCATTEALYAEYDEQSCAIEASRTEDIASTVKPVAAVEIVQPVEPVVRDKNLFWEPAVYFDYKQHDLTVTELSRLDRDLAVLKKYPELRLVIRGSTDSRGGDRYNRRLAGRRVLTVINYFLDKGLDRSRFEGLAVGEGLPILKSETETSHALNRRVELILLDTEGRPLRYGLELQDEPDVTAGTE